MYPIPPSEHLIENRACKKCSSIFPITDKDMEFYSRVSPVFPKPPLEGGMSEGQEGSVPEPSVSQARQLPSEGSSRYLIPPPTLCPDCRQQRRLAFRNERKLYKRKCDATGKDIVSIYSPDKPYTVYHQDYWWSDKWDPMSYGREFDFSRSAFEQFGEIMRGVPRPSVLNANTTNSEYANYSSNLKNCYLTFDVSNLEDCLYANNCDRLNNCIDISETRVGTEHCYECLDCNASYNIAYGWGCNNSHSSRYVVDIDNSHHCFLSHTLYNKSYYFENRNVSPFEYDKLVQDFYNLGSNEKSKKIEKWKKDYKTKKIYPYHLSVSFENSTGYGLFNTKNTFDCYSIHESQDLKYCTHAEYLKDCYDSSSIGGGGELCYELNASMEAYKVVFGFGTWGRDMYYTDHCSVGNNLFLCTGLRNKSYCILNKQYTKEEYEQLVPKIIEKMISDGEWGEFFPASLSPFGYNETVAQEYFPITTSSLTLLPQGEGNETFREAIVPHPSPVGEGMRVRWSLYEPPFPKVEKIIPASKLPDDITKIPDDILNWAIECEVSGKPFRIIKQELEFYRRHNLPIPKRHPDVRHMDRMKMRNPRKLYERLCDCEQCEENHKKKGIILKEGEDAEYKTEQNPQSPRSSSTAPLQRSLQKKIITTYSPERPERVYCEGCYELATVG